MTDYDSPWKEALEVYFEPFVRFFFATAHADIDWKRGYEPLDKELQKVARQAKTGRRTVDKLMKVWRRNGQEEWVLVHVEVQSEKDPEFLVRMYVYNYRLFDRYNRKVVSLAVLGDDRLKWRPDRFGYSLWGCTVDFKFPVVKLLDYAERVGSLERDANPFAAVVLAHVMTRKTRRNAESRWAWKVRLIKGLYERGLSQDDIRQLFRLIDWIMSLPRSLDRRFWTEIEKFEEARKMPYISSVERLGIEKGRKEGKKEGKKEAARETRQQTLIRLLRRRFGNVPASVVSLIEATSNTSQLDEWLDRFATAATLDELEIA